MENFLLVGAVVIGFIIGFLARQPKLSEYKERIKSLNDKILDRDNLKEVITTASVTASKEATKDLLEENKTARNEETKIVKEDIENTTEKIFKNYETISNAVSNIYEKSKETENKLMKHAENASLKATQDLLEKNKTARNEETKIVKEDIENTTKKIFENYETISKAVSNIYEKSKETQKESAFLKQYLFESAKVGDMSETTLENTVKNLGFEYMWIPHYETQKAIITEDGKVVPDMLIHFKNNDKVIIIDSKSSTALGELAKAEQQKDDEAIKNAQKKLAESMNKHLRDLIKKDYQTHVQKYLENQGKIIPNENISLFMWVGNDINISEIYNSDNDFIRKAYKNKVYIVSTSGLHVALGITQQQEKLEQQNNNNAKIIAELKTLFNRIATVSEKAKSVSNGLNAANTAWDSLITAFQGKQGVKSTVENINQWGVEGSKNIQHIPQIKVIDAKHDIVVDIDSTKTETNALPDKSD